MEIKINEELIACYIEGKCTPDEMVAVRQYLCQHPEKIEMIVTLLGNNNPIRAQVSNEFNRKLTSRAASSSIDYSAYNSAVSTELTRNNQISPASIFERANSLFESVERRLKHD